MISVTVKNNNYFAICASKQLWNFVKLFLMVCLIVSCSKKTEVSGYVYDKNNIHISGAKINLVTYASSKYAESRSHVATSDGNGHYSFNFKTKRNRYYTVTCIGDSGNLAYGSVQAGKINIIDLKFN